MNGLFGNCGGGGLFNHGNFGPNNGCNDCQSNGFDSCSIIIILLLLTCFCGCDFDWCTLIIIFLLLNCCGCGNNKCN